MKYTDEAIERLLAGLRDAEPASGFEQSIFAALRRAEATQSVAAAGRRRPLSGLAWQMWPTRAIACMLLVAVALILGWAAFVMEFKSGQRSAKLSTPQASAVVRPSLPPMLVAPRPAAVSRYPATRAPKPVTSAESNAAAGQSAWRNIPEPPLPLTEQEKLLQCIARRRNEGDRAVLNADKRNAQTAEATQQFQRFFAMTPEEMRSQLE